MGGGDDVELPDAQQLTLAEINPELAEQNLALTQALDQFRATSAGFLDPERITERREKAQTQAETASINQFAKLGLAGSSAAFGAAQESRELVRERFEDRGLTQAIQSLQAETLTRGAIGGNILKGQSLFQNLAINEASIQAQVDAANAGLIGDIATGVGTIAGFAIAGPAGGAAGGALAGSLTGGGATSAPTPSGPSVGRGLGFSPITEDPFGGF